MTISIGATVMTPVTDKDGEESYVFGTLTDLNSRYATIQTNDGEIVKVGKTKIEEVQKPTRTKAKKVSEDGEVQKERIADNYEYTACRAASGRISCDNGDDVAKKLRGKPLDEVYDTTARTIGSDDPKAMLKSLLAQYSHLNPGQQRMCLGNRIRGYFNKLES